MRQGIQPVSHWMCDSEIHVFGALLRSLGELVHGDPRVVCRVESSGKGTPMSVICLPVPPTGPELDCA